VRQAWQRSAYGRPSLVYAAHRFCPLALQHTRQSLCLTCARASRAQKTCTCHTKVSKRDSTLATRRGQAKGKPRGLPKGGGGRSGETLLVPALTQQLGFIASQQAPARQCHCPPARRHARVTAPPPRPGCLPCCWPAVWQWQCSDAAGVEGPRPPSAAGACHSVPLPAAPVEVCAGLLSHCHCLASPRLAQAASPQTAALWAPPALGEPTTWLAGRQHCTRRTCNDMTTVGSRGVARTSGRLG
jgi:hypothetical protein